jgi:regulator of sigma E protease
MLTTIIVFIVVLGVLVFVHEFGHFIVARKTGMKVEEFGFGFPPRLFGVQKVNGKWKIVMGHKSPFPNPPHQGEGIEHQGGDETIYSINAIPFGGFVKIMGENNEAENDPRSFINRPFWARFLTLVAGVSMNLILAVVLFSSIFFIGTLSEVDDMHPLFKNAVITNLQVAVSDVAVNSLAFKAGLKVDDIILKIDDKVITKSSEVTSYIFENMGKAFDFEVKRKSEVKILRVESSKISTKGQGPTGIEIADIGFVKLPFFSAIRLGVIKTVNLTKAIFFGFGKLFTSKEVLQSVGGPIKIAQITGEVYKMGITALMNFAGVLSVNLAVLNILPIPALDGGRVLFLIIEKIRRKRNNQKVEQWVNGTGFAVLLALMLVVTIKDIFWK